jgi:hypothetical protein
MSLIFCTAKTKEIFGHLNNTTRKRYERTKKRVGRVKEGRREGKGRNGIMGIFPFKISNE